MSNLTSEPIEVFFSYSHRDEALRDELAKHLSILERQGVITAWHDRQISAGSEWAGAINDNLNSAQIILLLISADFLASNFCYDVELKQALERHDRKEACVIPIILRPVDWSGSPFGKLQALPKNAKPVTSWNNLDEAFLNVVQGIRRAIEQINQQKHQRQPEQSEQRQIEQLSQTEQPKPPVRSKPKQQNPTQVKQAIAPVPESKFDKRVAIATYAGIGIFSLGLLVVAFKVERWMSQGISALISTSSSSDRPNDQPSDRSNDRPSDQRTDKFYQVNLDKNKPLFLSVKDESTALYVGLPLRQDQILKVIDDREKEVVTVQVCATGRVGRIAKADFFAQTNPLEAISAKPNSTGKCTMPQNF